MSGRTPRDFARATDPMLRRAGGLVRRFAIEATTKILWRLIGVELPDGPEQLDVEVFGNIGFYSRPLPGKLAAPEAIVVNVGDARAPVIVATRDAKGLSKLLKDFPVTAGETVIYSGSVTGLVHLKADGSIDIRAASGARVRILADGNIELLAGTGDTVEARTAGGTARKLAFHDELVALRDFVYDQFRAGGGHVHATPMGPTTLISTVAGGVPGDTPDPVAPAAPVGTDVLKGE